MSRASTPSEHEQGLALFIEPGYRARFRESQAAGRRREKLRTTLPHFAHLDTRFAHQVESSEQRASMLGHTLRARGAPNRCYLLSEDDELDGREMLLNEALVELVEGGSDMATFVSCIPGKLAYFHDEEIGNRHILERPE